MKGKIKNAAAVFLEKNKHAVLMLYWLIYLPWFGHLEKTVTTHFHVIHMAIDDYIPFCEYFIIPYFLWFAYIAWGIAYFYIKNKDEYFKLCTVLFTGMTIFLIISAVYPNGHYLRPVTFERDNIFTEIVRWLYATDTSTNLFPSIHVYNSIAISMAVFHADNFKKNLPVRIITSVLTVSIVLSTMFLKQHSVFDVITGILLAAFMYSVVYGNLFAGVAARKYERKVPQADS